MVCKTLILQLYGWTGLGCNGLVKLIEKQIKTAHISEGEDSCVTAVLRLTANRISHFISICATMNKKAL